MNDMRTVRSETVTAAVRQLCIDANILLPEDVKCAIDRARQEETFPAAKNTLDLLVDNYALAAREQMAICQDTGLACVFVEIGQDVYIEGDLEEAINEGVRQGYRDGYLRKSVVADPLRRVNTNDNTPRMIYYEIKKGDSLKITVAPKGAGSENMSAVKMLVPADGIEGVKKFVIDTVANAGPNPCPPIIVGVGIGGDFESAALMAKRMTARPLGQRHPSPRYARLEEEILEGINRLGIGPAGTGGRTTALAVHIACAPTHIAGLPVAVNICCHASRHGEITL